MAKYTLLEIVQKTLSAMESDRVDTIDEVEESVQIAEMAQDVFYEIINDGEWPHLHGAIPLTSPSDTSRPTALDLGVDVRAIEVVRYNIAAAGQGAIYRDLKWVDPTHFLQARSVDGEGRLLVTAGNGLQFYVATDRHPSCYTSFDDGTIYFDAVDQGIESVVQPIKCSCTGYRIPNFVVEDEHVPDLPAHFHPLLLAEVKKAAFGYFKNRESARDIAVATSQRAQLRRRANRTGPTREGGYFGTNFGRRR